MFASGQHAARKMPARAPTCRCNISPTGAHARLSRPQPSVMPRPLTSTPSSAHHLTHRLFHTTRRLGFRPTSARAENHYETLNVALDASTNEIKKSFYKLSKLHHPDHNPNDPNAPRRFMRISEAYSVLAHTDKRATYDRDVMRHHQSSNYHPHHSHTHRNASYHSTGPAGGRPASGLSRRRTQFKGPPPSFFRNTGSGQSQAYKPEHNGKGPTKEQQQQYEQQYGFGPGNVNQNDRGTRTAPQTPHFDSASNERTHRNLTDRAAERRATAAATAAMAEPSMMVGFVIIMTVIFASAALPALLFSSWSSSAARKKPSKAPRETA